MMGDVELQKFTDAAWYPVMNISGRTAEDCAIEPQLWAKTVGVHLVDLGAPAVPLRLVFKPFTESRRRDEQEERLR
jgi:hypothetical protein